MVEGVCVLLTMLVSINGAANVVWGKGTAWFYNSLVLFFITPALLGSYICRALRLAVVFHPKAKRALPWLIPVIQTTVQHFLFAETVCCLTWRSVGQAWSAVQYM